MFFDNPFSEQIWRENYQYGNETIEDTMARLANTIMAGEDGVYRDQLYLALINRRISFGGRIVANVGTHYKNTSNFNCYGAQRAIKPVDSIANIYQDLTNAAHILKTEGGIGFDFSHLRPQGTFIKGIGVGTPGVTKFMELYDKSSEIMTQGHPGGEYTQVPSDVNPKRRVRKGAMMGMLHISHPEILRFIKAKNIPNVLTKFNMSVIVTDKFMKALSKNADWELWFPDINWKDYDKHWNGDFDLWESNDFPRKVYETIPARDLWDILMESMYKRNEPGIWFKDAANRYNNLWYHGKVSTTNPCGEIGMIGDAGHAKGLDHIGDICNLGHHNMTQYVSVDEESGYPKFDMELFRQDNSILVRALDNLIDISGYPLEGLKNAALLRRKIGVGVLGYGSMLYMLGLRYGSQDANTFTTMLLTYKSRNEYKISAGLATEKGAFPLCDMAKIWKEGYLANGPLANDVFIEEWKRQGIFKNGLRNAQLSTCAPTGNTGVFMGLVSGGMEPVFEQEYYRWVIETHRWKWYAKKYKLDFPDFVNGDYSPTKSFKKVKLGDEEVLMTEDGNFMLDPNHGFRERIYCEDYGYAWAKKNLPNFEELKERGIFVSAHELDVSEHLSPFIIFSQYVDNSVSKTVNLHRDYPLDDYKGLWERLWVEGVRGITTYREGTTAAVLETKAQSEERTKSAKKQIREFLKNFDGHENGEVFKEVSLPDEYPARGFIIKSEGRKWYLHICFKDKQMTAPFAIFASTNSREKNVWAEEAVEVMETLARSHGIPEERIVETQEKAAVQSNVDKICRMVGLLCRHNVPIIETIKALDTVNVGVGSFVYHIKKFLMRFVQDENLQEFLGACPECGGKLRMAEGCINCVDCGHSKC